MVGVDGLSRLVSCALVWVVSLCAPAWAEDADARSCTSLQIRALATAQIAENVEGVGRVGGLSGLLPLGDGEVLAVSDNGARADVFRLRFSLTRVDAEGAADGGADGDEAPYRLGVEVVDSVALRGEATDAECVLGVDAMPGKESVRGLLVGFESPAMVEMFFEEHAGGGWAEAWGSSMVLPRGFAEGTRFNRSFESMAFVGGGAVERSGWSDGSWRLGKGEALWIATEAALEGEGPEATVEHGSLCRVLRISGKSKTQVYYETDAAPRGAGGVGPRFNSLAEMCGLGDGCVLCLERSFGLPWGWGARLYVVDGEVEEREGVALPVLRKRLVGDLREAGLGVMGNLEGMAVVGTMAAVTGDATEEGRLLLMVADDNFGRDGQRGSQVVAVRLSGE